MNNWAGIGNLVREVELKKTNTGKSVANFTIAINGYNDEVDFINCVAWENQADVLAKYTKKGTKIGLNGRINTRDYENNDGQKVYVTEVVVNQVHLIEKKPVSAEDYPTEKMVDKYLKEETPIEINSNDLPF